MIFLDICGENWTLDQNTGLCYTIVEQNLTWEEALTACRDIDDGAVLAFVRSEQEQQFIYRNLLQTRSCPGLFWSHNGCGVWIGLRDTVGNNRDYEWSMPITVDHTNWLRGEPNANYERCVAQQTVSPYKWWDAPCDAKRPALCLKQSCPDGWDKNPVSGVCYMISEERLNWVAAALKCKDLDSQLAILNSKEEDTFVEG